MRELSVKTNEWHYLKNDRPLAMLKRIIMNRKINVDDKICIKAKIGVIDEFKFQQESTELEFSYPLGLFLSVTQFQESVVDFNINCFGYDLMVKVETQKEEDFVLIYS